MRNPLFTGVLLTIFFGAGCEPGHEGLPAENPAMQSTDTPTVFAPGIISTGDYELNAMFEADGETVYFTKSTPDARFTRMTIVKSTIDGGEWSRPEVVSFSGQYSEVDPFLSPDGGTLYYISMRPVAGDSVKGDFDIWAVDRIGDGWSEPRHLPEPVNSDGHEYYPGVTDSGVIFFSAQREGGIGRYDLYRSEPVDGGYSEPVNLGEAINSESSEIDLYVAPDESYLIFVSYRSGGQGRGDLYISYNREGHWTPAENLGNIVNTPYREYTPVVSPDGRYLFFTSDRILVEGSSSQPIDTDDLEAMLRSYGNGLGDIYYLSVEAVGLDL